MSNQRLSINAALDAIKGSQEKELIKNDGLTTNKGIQGHKLKLPQTLRADEARTNE